MKNFYSPLRYPGGKAKVIDFMKEVINSNDFGSKPIYIEPYAGGAAVALGLLIDGYVSRVYINDFDPAIFSFWKTIKTENIRFIRKIKRTDITVDEWFKQREIYKKSNIGFELAFATFFLNRCNVSGVVKGGCIGGIEQKGKYKIDCRFNKEKLIEKIERIGSVADKISLYGNDTIKFLNKEKIKKILNKSLLYLDPPYYEKGYQLYKNFYTYNDHLEISKLVCKMKTKWIVSYDNVPEIRNLYKNFYSKKFKLSYSAGDVKKGNEIMFFSKKIKNIPKMIVN